MGHAAFPSCSSTVIAGHLPSVESAPVRGTGRVAHRSAPKEKAVHRRRKTAGLTAIIAINRWSRIWLAATQHRIPRCIKAYPSGNSPQTGKGRFHEKACNRGGAGSAYCRHTGVRRRRERLVQGRCSHPAPDTSHKRHMAIGVFHATGFLLTGTAFWLDPRQALGMVQAEKPPLAARSGQSLRKPDIGYAGTSLRAVSASPPPRRSAASSSRRRESSARRGKRGAGGRRVH